MIGEGWAELPGMLIRLGVAVVLALPVGWERKHREHSPGLRTFPLVAMGACAFLLIGQYAFRDDLDAEARVFQALLSGIGFIGGGAILKGRAAVHGLATAVSLWVTAGIGAAAAYRLYGLAAILSLITLGALHWLHPLLEPPGGGEAPPRERS
jgi:putative Mg2+ transporter-C (MgtC) family protein